MTPAGSRGGVAGRRLVAALIADGVPPEEIPGFYPSVAPAAARGARDFANYVDGYRTKVAG